MDWIIAEANQLTPQDLDRQGNKLLVGNGYIGYRGTLEEFTKNQKTATIVSGLYDKVGEQWREPVNLPNGCYVQVVCSGEPLHALTSRVLEHVQTLDMQHAVHERKTVFETKEGTRITVRSRRFASLARRHLICMEYTISADRECALQVRSGIDGDVWDINGPHLRELLTAETDDIIQVRAVTCEKRVPVVVSEAMVVAQAASPVGLPGCHTTTTPSGSFREFQVTAGQRSLTFFKFISHTIGTDGAAPEETGREICAQAARTGFEVLFAEHVALWSKRWEDCDIRIGGDPEAQEALRFSMYHLLAIVPAHTEHASIPARGLSGQMYKGAIFWDTEIFMLPFFTHAFPEIARKLLLYRYHTLDGARRKAADYGYRGAFYAWESQDTGDDACTLFNVTDVFTNRPMRTYFRDKQVHISADIPYAYWQYYRSTGDDSIWEAGGAEVVFECARFFLSYTYFNPDKRRYEILDVTGPDEYHERVHNNAFTNRLVAHAFEICLWVADLLSLNSPDALRHLLDTLAFEHDLDFIREIVPQLYQPDAETAGGVIPQFDGYFALENVPLKTLIGRKLHPHEYFGGGNGLATTTQIIKQADVILTLFLFDERYPLETKSANWHYYEPRTEHGSSLSACSYSLIAAQIGNVDWAYKYFMKTATIDLTGDGKQYVGSLYIGGTHPAGSGGAWLSAVFGLCGIRASGRTVAINPRLPAQWEKIDLPFVVQGQKLGICLTHRDVSVKALGPLLAPLSISVGGKDYPLPGTGELVVPLPDVEPA